MFSNISEVTSANLFFWTAHLLPMLRQARTFRKPLNPLLMKEAFVQVIDCFRTLYIPPSSIFSLFHWLFILFAQFGQIFKPYLKYCLEHSNCLHYVKQKHKESELFRAYVIVSGTPAHTGPEVGI